MFSTKEEMQAALDKSRNGMKFKGRELRVARAVEPKRREKKKNRQEAALQERRERRQQRYAQGDEDDQVLKNYRDGYSSEDSEDEKVKKRKADKQIRLQDTSFGSKKFDSQADKDASTELDLNNIHAIARKKKQALLQNMIQKGTTFKKASMDRMDSEEKDLYKGKHETFKKGLIAKIAKNKASNLKKINKIKIKSKKI